MATLFIFTVLTRGTISCHEKIMQHESEGL